MRTRIGTVDLQALLFVLLGLVLGSFGNVLIIRMSSGKSIGGRSHCMSCRHTLGVVDLIPMLSYICLGGRCRHCHAHVSLQYPIVEGLSLIVFLLAITLHPTNIAAALVTAGALWFLLLAATYDALHQELPDLFTIAIACAGTLLALLKGTLVSSILGATVALAWFGGQWLVSRGKAVGTGDIFLAAALGLLLGTEGTVTMILLSYASGALIILCLLAVGIVSLKKDRIAFGPFLAIGTLLSLLGAGQMYGALLP